MESHSNSILFFIYGSSYNKVVLVLFS